MHTYLCDIVVVTFDVLAACLSRGSDVPISVIIYIYIICIWMDVPEEHKGIRLDQLCASDNRVRPARQREQRHPFICFSSVYMMIIYGCNV